MKFVALSLLLITTITTGCVDAGSPTSQEQVDGQSTQEPSWSKHMGLVALDCTSLRIAIISHWAAFPFPPPAEWPSARLAQGALFDLHVYSCGEIMVGGEHVFKDVSFAWESHSNLSWKENPDFDSNGLHALIDVYVNDDGLAKSLEVAGMNITPARIEVSGGLESPRASIVSNSTTINLSIDSIPYLDAPHSEIMHVVPPESQGEWLRFEMAQQLEYAYGPWTLKAEGDSATAVMFNDPAAKVPNLQGYAAKSELTILWEDGFA